MANSENAPSSLTRSNQRSPAFHVVYQAYEWIPPAKRLLMEKEADTTRWWLLEQGIWQDSKATVRFPVDYSQDDSKLVVAYPILKHPNRPAQRQPTKYYLGSNADVYALFGSTFIPFGAGQRPMAKDIDYIIEKLRLTRNK